jgi:hypothetical protein
MNETTADDKSRSVRRGSRRSILAAVRAVLLDELYDLQSDSFERRNLASDPALAPVKASLRADLGKLVLEAVGLPP